MITKRWTELRPHEVQKSLYNTQSRFVVVPSGRRSGKTELAKRKIVGLCLSYDGPCEDYRLFCGAPTRDQAKRIYWSDLKALSPSWAVRKIFESDLIIKYINGAEIHVLGMDKPERVEGTPWDGGVLDEYANMKAKTWFEHVRPALADRKGFCWFIGVPEGRNHYYDLYKGALIDTTNEWNAYHWISSDILTPEEIKSAKKDLDKLTYEQEFEGSFVNFTGRAYYSFDEKLHFAELQHIPNAPLCVCFDFNVAPGVAVICQEFTMLTEEGLPIMNESITGVIGEVYIPQNSNTEMVCRKVIYDWADRHKGLVYLYGDATGGSGGSAKLSGNDWDIVLKMFSQAFGMPRVHLKVPRFNPSERSRINAVNSRLKSYDGVIRCLVDPHRAPFLIKDFEGVRLVEGGSGEIDKKHDPKLSHLCFDFNTLVETDKGFIKIGKLPFEGKIRTWEGSFVNYINGGVCLGEKECVEVILSNGEKFICTPDHTILTEKGWKYVVDSKDLIIYSWLFYNQGVKLCQKKNFKILMEKSIIGMEDILKKVKKDCIELFGNFIEKEKFLKDFVYIIEMVIEKIMNLKIYKFLLKKNIQKNICKNQKERKCQEKHLKNLLNQKQLNGMEVKKGEIGIVCMLKKLFKKDVVKHYINILAKCVGKIMKPLIKGLQSVLGIVKCEQGINQELIGTGITANIVGKNLEEVNILNRTHFVQENVISNAKKMKQRKEIEKFVIYVMKNLLQQTKTRDSVVQNAMVYIKAVHSVGKRKVYCPTVETGCFALKNKGIFGNSDSIGYYIVKEYPVRERKSDVVQYYGV